jgi:hypothetical protein
VSNSWRLTGLLPIFFFTLKVWQYAPESQSAQLLWFCNISNLMLGLAIFVLNGDAIFVTTALLLIGLPIWLFDVAVQGGFHAFSILTHVVSPALGLYLCRNLGVGRHAPIFTIGYYVALQLAARFLTSPADNINVAFAVYAPVKGLFSNFWVYSLANMAGLFAFAVVLRRVLKWQVPPSRPKKCPPPPSAPPPLAGEAGRGTPQPPKD